MKNSIFLVFYFVLCFGFSQELPPIQNFSAVDYGGANQNWSISQNKEKQIYIANNSGLLEYNGTNWKLYSTPNRSIVRSVKAIKSRIYTGCYMDFGYWEKDNTGVLEYQSISKKVQNSIVEDEQFWNILEHKDWVLFQSLQHIYIYHTQDNTITTIDAPTTSAHIFKVHNSIYFQKSGQGIFKIQNGASVLVSDDLVFKDKVVVGIFNINDKVTFLLENGLFYFLEENQLIQRPTSLKDLEKPISVYSSLQLQDGSIVLGTISNGIYQINKDGDIGVAINQEKGLYNNTVLSIHEDVENNLWLALDNGISVINLNSPFKEFVDKVGSLGQVYTSIVYEGHLYLGTNQGLFSKRQVLEEDFQILANTKGQVWSLRNIGGDLFCGHNNGTYLIKNNEARLISSIPGTWDVKTIINTPNLLIQGNYKGISVLEKKGNSWQLRNKIKGFDIASRFLEWVDDRKLVINHENKGVYTLQLDKEYTKVIKTQNQLPYGTGASLVNFDNKIIYTTSDGMFYYNTKNQGFDADEELNEKFFNLDSSPFGVLISDTKNNRLWGFSNTNILSLSPSELNGSHELIKIPIPSYFRNHMGIYGFETITPLTKNEYLIGTTNGYVTLNVENLDRREYKVVINEIRKNPGDNISQRISLEDNQELEYKDNSIAFYYSVPEYNKYKDVNYQYQLTNEHEDWSIWSTKSEVNFDNLPYGEYTFKVRATINNFITAPVSKTFSIQRPWYSSYLAYALYTLFFGTLIMLVHRQYKNYYKKQQALLLKENKRKLKRKEQKAHRKIIELKNEKLKEEITFKNRELASSTMSIIKKNEFLNVIKSQLISAKTPQEIKGVIRTIDRNINNADDWKVFEEAFNNADKDFLKKIKELHPDLTSNDLRLCAYLRLNLSTKEIAPLLNISSRSVEVKRYRLRKKMDLEHEKGLVDYILSI